MSKTVHSLGVAPVSYTHLDVYKRQAKELWIRKTPMCVNISHRGRSFSEQSDFRTTPSKAMPEQRLYPVSYTHLDVYKRQEENAMVKTKFKKAVSLMLAAVMSLTGFILTPTKTV